MLSSLFRKGEREEKPERFLQRGGGASRPKKPEPSMRKSIAMICILSSLLAAATVQAENWPSRLIKATIPFGPGSAADVVPRLVFDRLPGGVGQAIGGAK